MKAFKHPRGGDGGLELSAVRRKLALKAQGDLDEAYSTLLELMRTARRETVRFDAAVTVIEMADTGGEDMADAPQGTAGARVLIIRGGSGSELERRMDAERAAARAQKP